jgi:hypothetical protein
MQTIVRSSLIAVLMAVVTVLGLSSPTSAQAASLVTYDEYTSVRVGMPMARVHRIFDTRGVEFHRGMGYMQRDYRGWTNRWGKTVWVHVTYRYRSGAWRVEFKSARVPTPGDGW